MTNLVQRYIGEMGGPGRAGNTGAPGFSCCTRACCVVTVSVSAPVYSSSSAFYWHSKQISGPPLCPSF